MIALPEVWTHYEQYEVLSNLLLYDLVLTMLAPAAVIPLTDSEHAVLPVQFALDPGPQVDWGRDENNPNMLTTLQLADQEKLVLLKVDMSVHVW